MSKQKPGHGNVANIAEEGTCGMHWVCVQEAVAALHSYAISSIHLCRKTNFKTSTRKYIKMPVKSGSLLLKTNINTSLTTAEVRSEETKRNVAEDFVDLVKETREELRVKENPEKWTELDFGRKEL
jgi:hypothetical protein